MSEAVILLDRNIVRTTNLSELVFRLDGFVTQFKFNQHNYIYCDSNQVASGDLNQFRSSYYNEDTYTSYVKGLPGVKINELVSAEMKLEDYDFAQKDDTILITTYEGFVDVPEVFPKKAEIRWTYDPTIKVLTNSFNPSIIIPDDNTQGKTITETASIEPNLNITAKNFYSVNALKVLINNTNIDSVFTRHQYSLMLANITLGIHHYIEDIFPIFSGPEYSTFKAEQINYWTFSTSEPDFFRQNISYGELKRYFIFLSESYKTTYSNRIFINAGATQDEKQYRLFKGLSTQALATISSQNRINFIEYLIKDKLSQNFERIEIENLAIRIVESFNYDAETERNIFLDFLQTSYLDRKSVYELLYESMSTDFTVTESLKGITNYAFGTNWKPDKTKEGFVKSVFKLWLDSQFNPYDNAGNLKPHTLGLFRKKNGNIQYRDVTVNNSEVWLNSRQNVLFYYSLNQGGSVDDFQPGDKRASPLHLDYTSDSNFGYYDVNYRFLFNDGKIVAEKYVSKDIVYLTDEGSTYFEAYGTYSVLQPISIISTSNLETTIPILSIDGNTINVAGTNINSFVPVFVLKFLNDSKTRKNIENTLGLVFDIAITFAGIGNLGKLRHFKHLTRFRDAAILSETEILLRIEAKAGVNALVEVSSGVAGIILDYIRPENCQDPGFCESLRGLLTLFELASGGRGAYLDHKIRIQAKRVVDNLPSSGWPPVFQHASPVRNVKETVLKLADIADLIADFRQTRLVGRGNLLSKFDGLDEVGKKEFYYDFNNQGDEILDELDEIHTPPTGSLFDEWNEISELKQFRNDIEVLKGLKLAKNSDLQNHIFIGDLNPREGTSVVGLNSKKTFAANGKPNLINHSSSGLHSLRPPISEDIIVVGITKGPFADGFYEANIRLKVKSPANWKNPSINDNVIIDGKQSNLYASAKKSSMFPDAWSKEKINEEIALAYSRKMITIQKGPGKVEYLGRMSNGRDLNILVENGKITSIYPIL